MTEIKLLPEADYAAFVDILGKAYPDMEINNLEAYERRLNRIKVMQEEDPIGTIYGAYRDGVLVGGMDCLGFDMTWYRTQVKTGGVGMVAVDLLHKKEKVARDMIRFFLDQAVAQGMPLTALYPFRPDFYRKMGFGWGPKMRQYRFKPSALPRGKGKDRLRYLTTEDAAGVAACYDTYRVQTHGMMTRLTGWTEGLFNLKVSAIGYEDASGTLRGYLTHTFKNAGRTGGNFLKNDLTIHDWIALDREAQQAFYAYLHTQADQVDRMVYTTHDDSFQHVLYDPRSDADNMIPSVYHQSDIAGVGLMYRVVDVPGMFRALEDHDFGGQTVRLRLDVRDSFMPANAGPTIVHVANGQARVVEDGEADVTLSLDVSDLSSLVMGVVPLRTLYHYGMADLSNVAYLPVLDALFHADAGPVCMTHF
ncbi:MAG: GNAT family N-acetyltransferase [Anaerolineae bacterium]|nr:GNAT family N-acetyltransferase [Anaerolineae bacterium]